jgi:hypothetical protein
LQFFSSAVKKRLMPFDPTTLGTTTLRDWQGRDVQVGSLWANQPVVLVWLRHFG